MKYTEIVQSKKTQTKEERYIILPESRAESLDKRRQKKALPPSNPVAGSRFIAAKNKEAVLKRSRPGEAGRILEMIIEKMFAKGPERHKTASFL